jgi:mRNA interferase MazF
MQSTMIYKQGDVLLVPFPYTDQSAVKRRPAVVLSGESYNRLHPDIILAPITSQLTNKSDEALLSNWQAAGLLKPSVVKPILSSFDATLVQRRLGRLAADDLQAVRLMFAQILDLEPVS